MNIIRCRKKILLSTVCFGISACSFLFIPLSDFNGTKAQLYFAYLVGILFWLGLILGLLITFRLGNKRKKIGFKMYKFPGVLCFFKNKKSKVCDMIMLISFIILIILQRVFGIYYWISIIFLSITLFLVYLHSILNGNNYAYIIQRGVKK